MAFIDVNGFQTDRYLLVSQHFELNLFSFWAAKWAETPLWREEEEETLKQQIFDILRGLSFLEDHGIAHRNLTADKCLLNDLVRFFFFFFFFSLCPDPVSLMGQTEPCKDLRLGIVFRV